MKCLSPLWILPKDAANGASHLHREVPKRYRDIYPMYRNYIQVPCGKCIACLRNRQNAMVSRLYAEADKRGTFAFVTLTYDDEHLPLAETCYRVDKSTGEEERIGLEYVAKDGTVSIDTKPRIIHGHRAKCLQASMLMSNIKPGRVPRYIDRPLFDVDGFEYYARITPSANREDVRLWLKSGRVEYERTFGHKLPEFKYACVTEYGPKTCRPHYHLCFLGLPESEVRWLVARWTYGRMVDVKMVKRVNGDSSDGFRLASAYIGKYMSKGKFECQSVKDCTAQRPRLMQSVGLGAVLADKLREYLYAFDYVGHYDPMTLFNYDRQAYMSPSEVQSLVAEVSRRFVYTIGTNERTKEPIRLPVPRIIRQRVFRQETIDSKGRTVPRKDAYGRVLQTTISLLVSRYLCQRNADIHRAEFEQFLAQNKDRPIGEVVSEYNARTSPCAESSPFSRAENYLITFYNRSIF